MQIGIQSLKDGEHHFEFEVSAKDFAQFPQHVFNTAKLVVNAKLEKTAVSIVANIDTKGWLLLTCDRSEDKYEWPFHLENRVYYKFSNETFEDGDEIKFISWNAEKIDLSQIVFDELMVSIPIRKIHPRYKDEDSEQNTLVFTTLLEDDSEEDIEDERWNKLKNLNLQK